MGLKGRKKELRIVFMGTPEFAVAGLARIIDAGYRVVGVITAPDKPAGRGRKIQQSAMKIFALEKGLNILQPKNLKSEEFLETLKSLRPNLQIVVAFRMLPTVVWQIPEYGTFNLHASLLPQYRGAAPINWAVINGETKTGVTTFFIDDKIDTGEIILQKETEIEDTATAGTLHDKLMYLGAEVILKTVELIETDQVKTQKQPSGEKLKFAPKIFRDDCKIDWSLPTQTIYNFIRGLSPYPAAWTTLTNNNEEITVKLFEVIPEESDHNHKVGWLFKMDNQLKVATKNGYLIITVLQLSGKRKMTIQEALNGLKLAEEAYML